MVKKSEKEDIKKEKEIKVTKKTIKVEEKKEYKTREPKKDKEDFDKKLFTFPVLMVFIGLIIISIIGRNNIDLNNQDEINTGDIISNEITIPDEIINHENSPELEIGINKYLEFLWMVDGVFNKEKYHNEEFTVNGESLSNHTFKCEFNSDKSRCKGINFIDNYNKLFSKKVNINLVYGDGVALRWYDKIDDDYYFNIQNTCDVSRMNSKQNIILKENSNNKLVFRVYFYETVKDGLFMGNHTFDKEFTLVKEDGEWKVSKAYYHNPCYMEYNIE